jgi:hypothetical protein
MRNPDRRYRQPGRPGLASSRVIAARVAALGCLSIAACSPDRASAPTQPRAPRLSADVGTTATEQLLYQQAPLTGTNLFSPTGYESVADFTVPAGTKWKVTRLVLIGGAHDEQLYVNVYPDDGGKPGTNIVTSSGSTGAWPRTADPCCGGDVFDYNWPIGFTVDPGTYWLSVRSPFRPQLATLGGFPAMVGRWFPSSWVLAPLSAPNNDFAFSIYGTAETPSSATTDLQTTIEGFGLDYGTLNSFQAKLQAALSALDAGDTAGACRSLQDLINAVSAQSGKKLTVAQATAVIAEATRIRGLIGC